MLKPFERLSFSDRQKLKSLYRSWERYFNLGDSIDGFLVFLVEKKLLDLSDVREAIKEVIL